MERRKNERLNEQISQESPLSLTRYKSLLLHCIPSLRLLAFIVPEKSLTKNLTLAYMERGKNGRLNEQISRESPLSLTRYKSSLLHCILSLRLLAFIVPEKSLTENLTYLAHVYLELYNKKKKKGTNTRKCDRQKLDFLSNNYCQGTLLVYQI